MLKKYLNRYYYKEIVVKVLLYFCPKYIYKVIPFWYSCYYYKKNTGKLLNYNYPNDINQKLFWLSRYWRNPLIVKCADKYKVREYVLECSLGNILVPIYGVYNNFDYIDFDLLPDRFVLKTNNGYASNYICNDKSKIDIEAVKEKFSNWFNSDFGYKTAEYHYTKIEPKIICEKNLLDEGSLSLIDYKIHCINGEPHSILVCSERNVEDHTLILSSYSLDWDKLNVLIDEESRMHYIEKPDGLVDMINYARILSKPFPYVRVDFYYINNCVYFGELTFTPAANIMDYYKQSFLDMMGEALKLPKKSSRFN